MEDASGRAIVLNDHVAFRVAGGAHGDGGRVLSASERNTLVVLCVDGATVEVEPGDVTVVDRSYFYHGIVVASASDPGGQLGVVTGIGRAFDLVRLHGGGEHRAVAGGVSPGALRRVRELSLGDYVVSGPWLGQVVEVSLDVDVVFDDGAACRVTEARRKLRILLTQKGRNGLSLCRNANCAFYPGQRVVGHRSVFMASRWLKGYWKPNRRCRGTVAKVEMAGVLVDWVVSSELGTDSAAVMASAPPAYQRNPKNLTLFSSPPICYCYWTIGDRCFFRTSGYRAPPVGHSSSSGDHQESPSAPPAHGLATTRAVNRNRPWAAVKRMRRRVDRNHAEFERPMSVANTRTTVDVVWQDGTRRRGVPSASLLPFMAWNVHDFFPGMRVVRIVRGGDGGSVAVDGDEEAGPAAPPPPRSGVVRSVNCKDRTVSVSWLKLPGEEDDALGSAGDEILSAYDLQFDNHYDVFYGDVVVRLQAGGSGGSVHELAAAVPAAQSDEKVAAAGGDLSWVGHVTDLREDGHVQVEWGDGNTSKVLPREIAVVEPWTVGEMLQGMGDWVSDDGNMDDDAVGNAQEEATAAQEQQAAIIDSNGNGEGGDDGDTDDSDTEDGDGLEAAAMAAATGRVDTIIRAAVQIAAGVLAHCKKYVASEPAAALAQRSAPLTDGDGDEVGGGAAASTGGGDGEGGGDGDGSGPHPSFRFQQFDVIVQSPPDHHYLDNTGQGTGGGRKWTKRVQKEWDILKSNLPDTIFIRAYEDRMDLLRVVMVGASGTPYHDGLFFFDLQLPSSYPAAPPLVNYRSFGLRLNPNLYESGTVCLSLLDTFGGHGAELWSPEDSTVLQVVVSIQGLVLNAQPYYNEAGYAVQVGRPEGCRNELPYNENAYLLTLQTMLHLLRRPPVGFEGFVQDHFLRRGQHVLRACEAYLDGCPVGTLDGEARATEGSTVWKPCSTGLRLALGNVVPRLVEAFIAIGAQGCDKFDRLRVPAVICT